MLMKSIRKAGQSGNVIALVSTCMYMGICGYVVKIDPSFLQGFYAFEDGPSGLTHRFQTSAQLFTVPVAVLHVLVEFGD